MFHEIVQSIFQSATVMVPKDNHTVFLLGLSFLSSSLKGKRCESVSQLCDRMKMSCHQVFFRMNDNLFQEKKIHPGDSSDQQ